MTDFNDKFKLSEEDAAVWEAYVADMKQQNDDEPLQEENFATMLEANEAENEEVCGVNKKSHKTKITDEIERTVHDAPSKRPLRQPDQIDGRTEEKLRKGKVPIEERLDLHGFNKAQAHEKLQRFLIYCHSKNIRCALVITGKGVANKTSDNWLSPSKGVLKENVPYWLDADPLRYIVLKYCTAQPRDGGSGALYVYLKNKNK